MRYDGAYLRTPVDLVSDRRFDGDHELIPSEATLAALNHLQEVPLRVNSFVASVFQQAWDAGDQLGGLPPMATPLPEKPHGWKSMGVKARRAWHKEHDAIVEENTKYEKAPGQVERIAQVLNIFRHEPELYIPVRLEWRGRYMPVASDLAWTQGDLSRGLLRFRDEAPLTSEGERWLRIGIANAFGEDKVSYDERVTWADQHMELLLDSAENPLDGERFWTTASEPFLALALCHDLRRGRTATPCWVDATQSGIQHLAGLSRCAVTADYVNLTPGPRRDLYSTVAKQITKGLSTLAMSNKYAAMWREAMENPKTSRSIVKRPVMSLSYGATRPGRVEALYPSAVDAGIPRQDIGKACNWMAAQIEGVMDGLLPGPMFVLEHLKSMAATICQAGRDVEWTAPNGNVIRQRYLKLVSKQTRARLGRINYVEADTEVDIGAGIRGLVPQFIHAIDASHVTELVNRWRRDVVTVHDACSSNANNLASLHRLAIDVLAEMHQRDILAELYEEQARRHSDLAPQFVMPPYGTLDPRVIFQSEYAFS